MWRPAWITEITILTKRRVLYRKYCNIKYCMQYNTIQYNTLKCTLQLGGVDSTVSHTGALAYFTPGVRCHVSSQYEFQYESCWNSHRGRVPSYCWMSCRGRILSGRVLSWYAMICPLCTECIICITCTQDMHYMPDMSLCITICIISMIYHDIPHLHDMSWHEWHVR